jgi:hypothetical protein
MTALIIAIAVLVAVGSLAIAFARSRGHRLREEQLGNPHPHHAEPVVRGESRHRETPGGELDVRDGRRDD